MSTSQVRGLLKRKPLSERPYLLLTIFILVASALLYWQFVFGDKVFTFYDGASDTIEQYTKMYEYFSNAIKNGELSTYNFQNGFGNLVFSGLSYIANPFDMIAVLVGIIFGAQYIYDSLIFIMILKHLCGGLLCFYFLRNFKFSLRSSMIVSFLYAFSGYFVLPGQHYMFAKNPVYLLMILIFVEKTITEKRKVTNWIGLMYSCLLIALGGVTGMYEMFFTAGFYALFRTIYIYGKDYKLIVKKLSVCLVFVAAGVGIASAFILPVMEKITESSRLVTSNNIFALNTATDLRTGVLRLFSNFLDGNVNVYYGSWFGSAPKFPYFFSVLLIPVLVQYIARTFKDDFSKKDKIYRMLPVAVLVLAITDKFVALFFSAFVSHYDTYTYIFYPFFAYAFADVFDRLKKREFNIKINNFAMIVSAAIIIWGGYTTYQKGLKFVLYIAVYSVTLLFIGCKTMNIIRKRSNKKFQKSEQNSAILKKAGIALLAVLVLNSFSENCIMIYYNRKILTKNDAHTSLILNEAADYVNSAEKDNFFRFETYYNQGKIFNTFNDIAGRMYGYAYSFMAPIRATTYFDSSINNSIPEFYNKLFSPFSYNQSYNPGKTNYQTACENVQNSVVEDLLGIKYTLNRSNFSRDGWEKIYEYSDKGIAIFQNSGINSAGLLFDNYITQSEADNLSLYDRQLGLGTRLIIDNPPQNINSFASIYTEPEDEQDFATIYENQEPTLKYLSELDNSIISIDSVIAENGTINNAEVRDGKYDIHASMNDENSSVIMPLDTVISKDSNKSTNITVSLGNSNVLKSFAYLDKNGVLKEIKIFNSNVENGRTLYSFIIPSNASQLVITVNSACEFDAQIGTQTYDTSNEIFDVNSFVSNNGTTLEKYIKSNNYCIKAMFDETDSNFAFRIKKGYFKNINKNVYVSFSFKDASNVRAFGYYDNSLKSYKLISDVQSSTDTDKTVISFIVPKTADFLYVFSNEPGEIEMEVCAKSFTNEEKMLKLSKITPSNCTITDTISFDNQSIIRANMSGVSYMIIPLDTSRINDRTKSTLITIKEKGGVLLNSFTYKDSNDAEGIWKVIPKVSPVNNGDGISYSFILPQTAESFTIGVPSSTSLNMEIKTKTVTSSYISEGIQLDNPNRGDTLTGTVTAQKNSLLYLPIPFNNYWNAYIDGQKVDIIKANYAFMALPITAGEHTISLKYSNDAFNMFLPVSIVTFVLFNGFFIVYALLFKKKKVKAGVKKGNRRYKEDEPDSSDIIYESDDNNESEDDLHDIF